METGLQVKHRTLYVEKCFSLTNDVLRDYFQNFGDVSHCEIQRDFATDRPLGYALIIFTEPESVDEVQNHRPHYIQGHEVATKRAIPKRLIDELYASLQVNKLFVSGIHDEVQEQDLRNYFSLFGIVKNVEIVKDRVLGTKRGFAFLEFDDYDVVDKVVLHGRHTILGTDVKVEKAKSSMELKDASLSRRMSRIATGDRRTWNRYFAAFDSACLYGVIALMIVWIGMTLVFIWGWTIKNLLTALHVATMLLLSYQLFKVVFFRGAT